MANLRECDRIELSLPANRDLMLVARLATAGVVARAGLTLDVLDDVKMAVEEACLFLMTQAAAPERLRLSFALCPQAFSVEITCEGTPASGEGAAPGELEVVRCILESLVRSVDIRASAEGVASILLEVGAAG